MSQSRVDRLRKAVEGLDLDAVLITDPTNRRYLTSHTGGDHGLTESGGVVLVSPNASVMLVSKNNLSWARSETVQPVEVRAWEKSWIDSVVALAEDNHWLRIGFEDSAMLVSTHRTLAEKLGIARELIPIDARATLLRAVKDDSEIAVLERAIRITDQVAIDISMQLTPGVTERDVARKIDELFRAAGADGPGFSTIVASGPNSARPHHAPSDRRLQTGDAVIIDMGASVDGYTADLTRTFWVGSPTPYFKTVYNAVARAHAASLARVRAGSPLANADRAARESLAGDGFEANVIHSVGHGIGLEIHEAPSLSIKADGVFEVGQVVTIEPGVYFPEWGGVRIEDVVVVTVGGYRMLSAAPK